MLSPDTRRLLSDRRLLAIVLLGYASGLPLSLTTSTLAWWLATLDVDLATIGLFTLAGLPYALKFLWAPVFDAVAPPFARRTRGLKARRAWILTTQAALIVAILLLGGSDPVGAPWLTAASALAVAFTSASQDIAVDGYRIAALSARRQAAGAFAVQFGYRIGLLVAGAGALLLSQWLSWFYVYAVMAFALAPGVFAALWLARPPEKEKVRVGDVGGGAFRPRRSLRDLAEPLLVFVRSTPSVVVVLLFIPLYKLGDAVAGVMSYPFFYRLGFSASEVAAAVKGFGFAATMSGLALGGWCALRFGLWRALMLCGVLQLLSNLLFIVQARVGHDVGLLFVVIGFENLAGGMGSVAFVAYLSALSSRVWAATHYALLSSFAVFGRTLLASLSGWLAERTVWEVFFAISAVAALPALFLLWWLRRAVDDVDGGR